MIFKRLKQKPEEFDPFEVAQKGSSVIKSCVKPEQVPAARRYASLLMEQKKEQMVPSFMRAEQVSKMYDKPESVLLATAVGVMMANTFLDSQADERLKELDIVSTLNLEDIPDGDYETTRPVDNRVSAFDNVSIDGVDSSYDYPSSDFDLE